MLQGSLEGGLGADAVELIAADGAVVLGAEVPGLAEIGGVDVRGQLLNVFRVGCGRIVAVEDYALREEALAAAGTRGNLRHEGDARPGGRGPRDGSGRCHARLPLPPTRRTSKRSAHGC
jgi:hypothetical protein